ncbi:MAG TPA: hypothetical protein VK035_08790 [Kiloniellales bacterium]|nr:hypothetical protein [Kiloniellales bacterium]
MKQFFSLSLLTSLIALFLLPAALAQEELAQRAQVRAWIEGSLLQGDLLQSLSFDGPPKVEETAQGWRLLLPPARTHADDDQDVIVETSEAVLEIGAADAPGMPLEWRLPAELLFLDAHRGDEIGRLLLGGQRGSGFYARDLESFLYFDTLLQKISLNLPHAEVTLSELRAVGESGVRDDGRLDSDSTLRLQDLAVTARPWALKLGNLRLDSALIGFDRELHEALFESLRDERDAVWSFAEPGLEAGAATLQLEDFAFTAGVASLNLGAGDVALAAEGLESPHASLVLQTRLQELQVSPLSALAEGLLPRKLQLDVEFEGLPTVELDPLVGQFRRLQEGAGTSYAGGLTLPDFWRLLQRNRAKVEIGALAWDAPLLQLEGTAALAPDIAAALGLAGRAELEIGGLPALVQQLRSQPGTENLVQFLTLLQGLGTPLQSSDPAGTRRYEILITAEGRLEVNGTDIIPLVPALLR